MDSIDEENRNVINDHRRDIILISIKVSITILCLSPLIHYSIYHHRFANVELIQNLTNEDRPTENRTIVEIFVKQQQQPQQPSCLQQNKKLHFENINRQLFLKQQQCSPGDFTNLKKHELPTNKHRNITTITTSESRGMIISCFIGGLLLTSLIAALIELYKAKYQQYTDYNRQKKTSMNRKYSLADLTVLKHNRKELMRRDSLMEIPEMADATTNNKQLMGVKPVRPLYRRSSFPVGPHEFTVSSTYHQNDYRRPSINTTTNRRLSTTIDNSRRNSLIIDSRKLSIDCRQIDDSPERRHRSRLVHR